jgi:hypothetical protein
MISARRDSCAVSHVGIRAGQRGRRAKPAKTETMGCEIVLAFVAEAGDKEEVKISAIGIGQLAYSDRITGWELMRSVRPYCRGLGPHGQEGSEEMSAGGILRFGEG